MLHAMWSNYQKCVRKYILNQKGYQLPRGTWTDDRSGQLLFDRMSDPLVVMELIVCKCNRMCKGPECQWFSNALM